MEDRQLLDFIKRIVAASSQFKAGITLSQLERILDEQNAPSHQRRMVRRAIEDYPETYQIVKTLGEESLTEQDMEIAAERAHLRRKRELELGQYGRC